MPAAAPTENAYIITGPTSGIGRRTALELAKHGTVVLVGRDRKRLGEVRDAIKRKGGSAVSVVCDLSEPAIVRRAADQIVQLGLPAAGLRRLRHLEAVHARHRLRVRPRDPAAALQRLRAWLQSEHGARARREPVSSADSEGHPPAVRALREILEHTWARGACVYKDPD